MAACFQSSFLYFQYELLFCIQDEMDASRMIVQSLIDKYPNIDAKMFLGKKDKLLQ